MLNNYLPALFDCGQIYLMVPLRKLDHELRKFLHLDLINANPERGGTFHQQFHLCRHSRSLAFKKIDRTAIAAGVIPAILDACTRVSGLKRSSFSRTSAVSPFISM